MLTILERSHIPQNAIAMGERLRSGLAPLVDRGRGVLALRQAGLVLDIDIGRNGMPAAGRRAMALAVVNAMRDDGVLVSTKRTDEDALKVRPPLVRREEHVDRFLEASEAALTTVRSTDLRRAERTTRAAPSRNPTRRAPPQRRPK